MAMPPKQPRVGALVGLAVLAAASCRLLQLRGLAFASSTQAAVVLRMGGQGLHQPPAFESRGPVFSSAQVAAPEQRAPRASLAGLAFGGAACTGALVLAAARRSTSTHRARTAARVASGAPSLIQILEQKKLLSTAEGLKLLSAAEKAGVGIATVEELGLLKLAEDLKLLSLAESLLTSPTTPLLLLGVGAGLAALAFVDVSAPDFGFTQWVIAGALGAPAVVLLAVAVVVFGLTAGTRRTKSLDIADKVLSYDTTRGFSERAITESATLLETLEKRQVLSFLEQNRLLSLAASLVNRPLTLTENLRVLSTLESSGLLSTVESQATDTFGAAKVAGLGLLFLLLAVVAFLSVPGPIGLVSAVLLLLPGLALLAVGIAIGTIQPPRRFSR